LYLQAVAAIKAQAVELGHCCQRAAYYNRLLAEEEVDRTEQGSAFEHLAAAHAAAAKALQEGRAEHADAWQRAAKKAEDNFLRPRYATGEEVRAAARTADCLVRIAKALEAGHPPAVVDVLRAALEQCTVVEQCQIALSYAQAPEECTRLRGQVTAAETALGGLMLDGGNRSQQDVASALP
jgi:hypothetical protein